MRKIVMIVSILLLGIQALSQTRFPIQGASKVRLNKGNNFLVTQSFLDPGQLGLELEIKWKQWNTKDGPSQISDLEISSPWPSVHEGWRLSGGITGRFDQKGSQLIYKEIQATNYRSHRVPRSERNPYGYLDIPRYLEKQLIQIDLYSIVSRSFKDKDIRVSLPLLYQASQADNDPHMFLAVLGFLTPEDFQDYRFIADSGEFEVRKISKNGYGLRIATFTPWLNGQVESSSQEHLAVLNSFYLGR